jgi:hypothetical protein
VAARTIGYGLIVKALLDLKLLAAIQTTILIGRYVYPPLLQKKGLLFFRAMLARDLHPGDLLLRCALSRFEFAI